MGTPFHHECGRTTVAAADTVSARISVPGSKSLTNRYLLLAAMANGDSELVNPLESDDTRYMRQALQSLGVAVETQPERWIVHGSPAWNPPGHPLFVGNAGTVMRFLSPALARHSFAATMTGDERMCSRPIADLVDGLRCLKVHVDYQAAEGVPPIRLQGPMRPGHIVIKGRNSSQYLSGLLMAAPLLAGDTTIAIEDRLVSRTYVEMTIDCMGKFGVTVQSAADYLSFRVPGHQVYQPARIVIEPDASTASYWFALPLMVGGHIEVTGVPEHSRQGDFGLLAILAEMGAETARTDAGIRIGRGREPLRGIEVDMNTLSDVAPTLAVVASQATTPTLITNIGNMRIKECDRIETLRAAFESLGLPMETGPDWMKIYPGRPLRSACLNPQDDHRMAMAFTLLGLAFGGVQIADAGCVSKTYPGFFKDFDSVLRVIT